MDENLRDLFPGSDRKIKIIVIFRVLLVCSVLILLISCEKLSEQEMARKIEASEELSQIDKICAEFPKPPGSRQIKKGISETPEVTSVYYQYSSDLPFDSIRNFYQDAANRGGYQLISENYTQPEDSISVLRFLRDDVGITLEHRPPAAILNVACIR